MKKISTTLLILALAGLALLVAGCGSSSDAASDVPTKAEFIKQADALCKKVDEREAGEFAAWAEANDKSLQGLSIDEVGEKAIVAVIIPSIRNEIGEVKAIGIPEGDEEQLEGFFDAVEAGLKTTEKDPLSAEQLRSESSFFDSYKLGHAYGFNDCDEMY